MAGRLVQTIFLKKKKKFYEVKECRLHLRWWYHDLGLPGWNFNPFNQDRFHPTILWGNQISSLQGGSVFHLVFVSICLHFLLIFFSKHVLNYCFIMLRQAEAITWENFVPAKRDPGSTKEGSRLAGMKLFACKRRIQSMKSLFLFICLF